MKCFISNKKWKAPEEQQPGLSTDLHRHTHGCTPLTGTCTHPHMQVCAPPHASTHTDKHTYKYKHILIHTRTPEVGRPLGVSSKRRHQQLCLLSTYSRLDTVLCSRLDTGLYTHPLISSQPQSGKGNTDGLGLREAEQLAQGHKAR